MSISKPDADGATEPTWAVAELFPPQGYWSDADYLALGTNRLVELSAGHLEVLPMPTEWHQEIAFRLAQWFSDFARRHDRGKVLPAPLRVRVGEGRFREPDVVFMSREHRDRRSDAFWDGADLVMEVVSETDPDRDLVTKRREYAAAGIGEYWIVDPRDRTIQVLVLDEPSAEYVDAGRFAPGDQAASVMVEGFTVDVEAVFQRE